VEVEVCLQSCGQSPVVSQEEVTQPKMLDDLESCLGLSAWLVWIPKRTANAFEVWA